MNALARHLFAGLFCTLAVVACAHEGEHASTPVATPVASLPAAIALPPIDGPKPWSDKPLLNDPQRFQIAIMTDRTGGHRPGVWMDAVRKLNLLRPEFVVSVGDLIEGYTEDKTEVERQWKEFLGFIDELQMRFFFVAGNHDITNPTMHTIWRKHFGREWYSFDYKGVHFLCLNSEDPHQHLEEEQLAFIKKDLVEHADARWTLVFLHKPLWTYAENQLANDGKDRTNWKRVEALLVDRPHTVFAGHVHNYVQYQRNGHDYYSLATTGGGSRLRGNEYGEFDHITWLTMEPEGPHLVNLRLDGILPADIVTESSAARFRDFLRQVTVEVAPILVDDKSGFVEGNLSVRLTNRLGKMVDLTGQIDGLPLQGLTVNPEAVRLVVGPTGSAEQTVGIRFSEPIGFDRLRRATFTARIESDDKSGQAPLIAERTIPILIDRRYHCPRAETPLVIDGVIEEWPAAAYDTGKSPLVVGAAEQWKGTNDGSLAITTSHDDNHLYICARITDERVIAGKDSIALILDGRPAAIRREHPGMRRGTTVISIPAPKSKEPASIAIGPGWRQQTIEGVTAAGSQTATGYDLEVAIPANRLRRPGGKGWKSFQLSAVLTDADDTSLPAAEIVWRGTPQYRRSNANFATFSRDE